MLTRLKYPRAARSAVSKEPELSSDPVGPVVNGTVAPKFQAVREGFERNLAERGELGSSFCVTVEGEIFVVDPWGGSADETTDKPWAQEALSVVFSVSKAIAASCLRKLIGRRRSR
jgi:CubicO group peptidase (beta-lactamase class C family)